MRDGREIKRENRLIHFAAYATGTNGRSCGAVVYRINADDSLDGTWGVNSSGAEKAASVGDANDGVGAFNVSARNERRKNKCAAERFNEGWNYRILIIFRAARRRF